MASVDIPVLNYRNTCLIFSLNGKACLLSVPISMHRNKTVKYCIEPN